MYRGLVRVPRGAQGLGALAGGAHPVIRDSWFWLFGGLSVRARAHAVASPRPRQGHGRAAESRLTPEDELPARAAELVTVRPSPPAASCLPAESEMGASGGRGPVALGGTVPRLACGAWHGGCAGFPHGERLELLIASTWKRSSSGSLLPSF